MCDRSAKIYVKTNRKISGKHSLRKALPFTLRLTSNNLPFLALALMTLANPVAVQGQSSDLVQTRGKAPLRGNITSMNSTEITITVAGKDRTIAVNELVNVSFRGEPSELGQARRLAAIGNYEATIEKLKQIDSNSISRIEVKQDLEFYQGKSTAKMALAGSADVGKAVRQLRRFIKVAADNYHYYEAVELLGKLALSIGEYKRAVTYFGELAKAPWQDYKLKARGLRAQAQRFQGEYDDALKSFRQVSESKVIGDEANRQKSLAKIGMASCYAEMGQIDQGISIAQEVLQKNKPDEIELNAKAYNVLGVCYLRQDKPKDALLAFLHTELLYSGQRDAHAQALYHLTQLWNQMNKKGRAQTARGTLMKRYANSIWTKKL